MNNRLIEDVSSRIQIIRSAGDLTTLTPTELFELIGEIETAHGLCFDLLSELEESRPSVVWFAISTVSGFGGLLILEPTTAAIVITIGGIAGACKSIYDRSKYLSTEQEYLQFYWVVVAHKRAVQVELRRRGIV